MLPFPIIVPFFPHRDNQYPEFCIDPSFALFYLFILVFYLFALFYLFILLFWTVVDTVVWTKIKLSEQRHYFTMLFIPKLHVEAWRHHSSSTVPVL
jgi:hypothetical protein